MAQRMAAHPAIGLQQAGISMRDGSEFPTTLAREEEHDGACFRSPETRHAFACYLASR